MTQRPRRTTETDLARSIVDDELAEQARRSQRLGPLGPPALVEELLRLTQHRGGVREQVAFAEAQARNHRAPAYPHKDPRTQRGIELSLAWACIAGTLKAFALMTVPSLHSKGARLSKSSAESLLLVSGEYRDQAIAHIRASGVRTISEALAEPPLPN